MPTTRDKTYTINEIFYSVQGEGIRAGTANVFVRFTGCNQTCAIESHGFDCDTEFASGRKMTASEIASEIKVVGGVCEWCIFTGGEPGLQINMALCDTVRTLGRTGKFQLRRIAIETNGSIDISKLPVDWITVSPKVAEHAIRQKYADEVKYVRGYGQALPKTVVKAKYKLISPAFDGMNVDQRTLDWCLKLVKENPEWRLSPQMHKLWSAR